MMIKRAILSKFKTLGGFILGETCLNLFKKLDVLKKQNNIN